MQYFPARLSETLAKEMLPHLNFSIILCTYCGGISLLIGSHRIPSHSMEAYRSLPPEMPLFLRPLKSVLTVKELIIKYN